MTGEEDHRRAELERVLTTYPPMGRGTVAVIVLGTLVLGVAGLVRDVSLSFWVGGVVAAALWELTKLRLRRNARAYASPGDA